MSKDEPEGIDDVGRETLAREARAIAAAEAEFQRLHGDEALLRPEELAAHRAERVAAMPPPEPVVGSTMDTPRRQPTDRHTTTLGDVQ